MYISLPELILMDDFWKTKSPSRTRVGDLGSGCSEAISTAVTSLIVYLYGATTSGGSTVSASLNVSLKCTFKRLALKAKSKRLSRCIVQCTTPNATVECIWECIVSEKKHCSENNMSRRLLQQIKQSNVIDRWRTYLALY